MQKITTFLTFDNQAEPAAEFYVSIFDASRIVGVSRTGGGGTGDPGRVMSVSFELAGQPFMALNGGPTFSFCEGISLFVNCEDQAEVDRLWASLTDGGEAGRCGWLKDRFGVSWQIIPSSLGELLSDPDRDKADRVMQAMLKMDKIIIEDLERAGKDAPEG